MKPVSNPLLHDKARHFKSRHYTFSQHKSRQYGFNMMELMFVVAVTAILAAIAAPVFFDTIMRNNVIAESNRLIGSLNFARSRAVSNREIVTLSRKSATARNWAGGWTIYTAEAGNDNTSIGAAGVSAILLKDIEGSDIQITIKSDAHGDNWISFNQFGRLEENGNDVALAICPKDTSNNIEGRLITVSPIGRTTVTPIAAADKAAQCSPN
jgi:type IV fimbrial biogenesis protein FimT